MSLSLSMIRCPDSVAPERREVAGGEFSIGRGPDNDWILADPDRHMSKRHCQVAFRGGQWHLADLSANGTYLNNGGAPVGQGVTRPLRSGDRITFGAYEIEVGIEEAPAYGTPARAAPGRYDPAPARNASSYAGLAPDMLDPFADPPAPHRPFGGAEDPMLGERGAHDRSGIKLPADFNPLDAGEEDPFRGPTQADHAPALDGAFRPPPSRAAVAIPDDWDLDLSPAAAPVAPVVPTPPSPRGAPPAAFIGDDDDDLLAAPAPAKPPPPAVPPPRAAPPPSPKAAPPATFIGDDDDDLLAPPVQTKPPPPAVAPPPRDAPPPFPAAASPAGFVGDDDDDLLAPPASAKPPPPVARPVAVAPPPPQLPLPPTPVAVAAPPAVAAGDGALMSAFLRGAGLAEATLPDPGRTMTLLGAALRATVSGIRQVLIARASVKGEFRIEQTMIRANGNNPLKFSADDDDAMAALLGVGRRNTMPPAAAVSEALRDMRMHELATVTAMQSAVRALLAQFTPATIEQGTEKGGLGILPGQRKARAWDAFEAMHNKVSQALSDDFDSVFGKAFARAYEQAMHELSDREPKG